MPSLIQLSGVLAFCEAITFLFLLLQHQQKCDNENIRSVSFQHSAIFLPALYHSPSLVAQGDLSSFFFCVCKPQGICPCLGSPSCWSLRKVGPYNDSPEGIQGQVLRGLGLGSTHWGSIRMSILGRSSHAFILVPINIHFTMVASN